MVMEFYTVAWQLKFHSTDFLPLLPLFLLVLFGFIYLFFASSYLHDTCNKFG